MIGLFFSRVNIDWYFLYTFQANHENEMEIVCEDRATLDRILFQIF